MPNFNTKSLLGLVFIFGCLLLQGCPTITERQANYPQAEKAWAKLIHRSEAADIETGPFNALMSIRYKTPEEGYRMGAIFWGNGELTAPHPLRFDIQGAMGSSAIKIIETKDRFVLYDTENNKAYVGASTNTAFLNLGMPLPFNLADFSLLLNGRYASFIHASTDGSNNFETPAKMPMPELAASTAHGDSIFNISHHGGSATLTVNPQGLPIAIVENGDKGWTMEITYEVNSNLPGPSKILVTHPDGYSVLVVFRSVSYVRSPFSTEQLDLILPENISETIDI